MLLFLLPPSFLLSKEPAVFALEEAFQTTIPKTPWLDPWAFLNHMKIIWPVYFDWSEWNQSIIGPIRFLMNKIWNNSIRLHCEYTTHAKEKESGLDHMSQHEMVLPVSALIHFALPKKWLLVYSTVSAVGPAWSNGKHGVTGKQRERGWNSSVLRHPWVKFC